MKRGLYANIHAKRKRGERMRKKGDPGAPSDQDFKDAAKTAKKRPRRRRGNKFKSTIRPY